MESKSYLGDLLDSALDRYQEVEVPEDLEDRVLSRLQDQRQGERRRAILRAVGTIAAGLLVLWLVQPLFVSQPSKEDSELSGADLVSHRETPEFPPAGRPDRISTAAGPVVSTTSLMLPVPGIEPEQGSRRILAGQFLLPELFEKVQPNLESASMEALSLSPTGETLVGDLSTSELTTSALTSSPLLYPEESSEEEM